MHFRKQCQKEFYLLHPPEKIIIDCKGGIYDIQAITLAFHMAKKYDKEIIGITCVAGGQGVQNAALDALYACKLAKVNVPIYQGSRQTFLLKKQRKTQIFGYQNNKELLQKLRSSLTEEDKKVIVPKTVQAIKFIVQSHKKFRQKLGIICLGPLTNIALAYNLEYSVGKSGMVSIAGGQYTGVGNVIGQYSSEKNFQFDPHAAHIVIDNFNHNVFLSTIQTALEFEEWEDICQKINAYFKNCPDCKYSNIFFSNSKKSFGWQEILATFPPFIRRSAKKQFIVYAEISLETSHIEGFVAIDWVRMKPQFQQKPNTKIYSQFDNQLICQEIQSMIFGKQLIGPKQLIKIGPKAQLHLHIEGTLQPSLLLRLAEKNKIPIKYKSLNQVQKAYKFENLKSFLQLYNLGSTVLVTEQDFFEVTWQYIVKANADNVKHSQIFFDAQTHATRGVNFETIINGIYRATQKGKKEFGMSFYLIMCFLRDKTEQQAFEILKIAANHKDKIIGVGLASAEHGNPPSKFKRVFQQAGKLGFLKICHAGQEGPPSYIREAFAQINARRIGHGIRCLEDQNLVQALKKQNIPLTVCPLANVKLCQTKDLQFHPIKKMFDKGLKITINSDDPSYFGGYINENFLKVYEKFDFTVKQLAQIMINSFEASFLSQQEKDKHIAKIKDLIK